MKLGARSGFEPIHIGPDRMDQCMKDESRSVRVSFDDRKLLRRARRLGLKPEIVLP